MRWRNRLTLRLRSLFRRKYLEEELDAELRFHLDQQIDEHVATGVSLEEARAMALRSTGGLMLIKEHCRDALGVRLVDEFQQDIRYACRALFKRPGFAVVAVLTLALGIGTTTTLFSVAYGVLVKPLPWAESDRLMRVTETRGGRIGRVRGTLMNGTFIAWADHPSTIDGLGGWLRLQSMTMTERGSAEPRRVAVVPVTSSLFPLLLARPLIGRLFAPTEGARGSQSVALLSYGLWQDRFGGRPEIVGHEVQLDDRPATIIGVMPRDFAFPDREAQLWTAWAVPGVVGQGVQTGVIFSGIARLRAGLTPTQAAVEATARARAAPSTDVLATALFGAKGPIEVQLTAAREALTAEVRPAILLLLIGAGLLLAATIANVASLQVARASTRQHEIGIRAAIGASALRLMRELLVESAVLGVAGGAMGLALAVALHRVLPAVLPPDFPRLDAVTLDVRVVFFAIAVVMATSILCGIIPAIHARRVNLTESLSYGRAQRRGGIGLRATEVRMMMMAGEVAIACVLLLGALLLTRSFLALVHADRGYDPVNVLTATLPLPPSYSPDRRIELANSLLESLRTLPGVTHVAVSNALPFLSPGGFAAFRMLSPRDPGIPIEVQATQRIVTTEYFDALRLRVIAGRALTSADSPTSPPALVVNRSFARAYLGDRVVGAHIQVPKGPSAGGFRFRNSQSDWEVVGLVEDMRQDSIEAPLQPEMFMSFQQILPASLARLDPILVLRTVSDPVASVGALRAVVRGVAPSLALDSVMSMEDRVTTSLARPRMYARLLSGFAVCAVAIAGVGLFGVLSYLVSQRSREFGIRTALGAQRHNIAALVLKQAIKIALTGLVVGMAASFALRRYLVVFLFGVSPHDAISLIAVGLTLIAITAAASYVPARRATVVDPIVALRYE